MKPRRVAVILVAFSLLVAAGFVAFEKGGGGLPSNSSDGSKDAPKDTPQSSPSPSPRENGLSTSGLDTMASPGGSNVEVTFSVTNHRSETASVQISVQNETLPAGWTITDLSASDPDPQDMFAVIVDPPEILFSDVDPGEKVVVTASVSIPSDAPEGEYTIDAIVSDISTGERIGTSTATIMIE